MDGNYFRLSIADSTKPRETDVWAMVLRKDSLVMEKYVEDFDRAGVFGPEFRLDSSRRYHLSEADSNRLWQIVRSADPTKWEGIYSAGYERSGNVTWNTTYLTGVRTYVSHGRNRFPAEGGAAYLESGKEHYIEEIAMALLAYGKQTNEIEMKLLPGSNRNRTSE